ncbi:ATP-dependent DNA helicase [Glaciihabitans sp. GrIS 2.15]|uniref:ATP-dependent DNA helicase n=1 Tax=Glaciihabitans sp. GrIS 2.15 TaxID=3071710 RepID=UPI002E0265ED|nr:energy-coupling factor transporter ATP-binding protein EcfA2 [Glaciihabitans sp. GrIS 2.15]
MSTVEEHIRLIDIEVSRAIVELAGDRQLLSRKMLAQLRDLIEGSAVLVHTQSLTTDYTAVSVGEALADVSAPGGSAFLHRFHRLVLADGIHHTIEGDTPERLMLKYYEYLCRLRDMLRDRFRLHVLKNLDSFPVELDSSLREYHRKIAARISASATQAGDEQPTARYYVQRTRPFFVDGHVYYEVTFTNSVDRVSKFDRVIAFTHLDVSDRYAANLTLRADAIDVLGQSMPIILIVDWEVSIRPCELQNLARIVGPSIRVSTTSNEYGALMGFLTTTGASLTELIDFSDERYAEIRARILRTTRSAIIFPVLDRARQLVRSSGPGSNVLRYLMLRTKNVVLRQQYSHEPCGLLSNLNLRWGCIPFDQMPYCTSLPRHNPRFSDLADAIDPGAREHELLARTVKNNVERRGLLYTPIEELESFPNVRALIQSHNQALYRTHTGRTLEIDDEDVFIRQYEDNIVRILERLRTHASVGVGGWRTAVDQWLSARPGLVDDDMKSDALRNLFGSSRVALVYGSAGTGKSTMVNYIASLFNEGRNLFLANTHPAVDNLRRKVQSQYPKFNTVAGQIARGGADPEYELVVIDECSTVSNEDLVRLLESTKFKVLVLVGDVYQIESIQFGNWFGIARHFLPASGVFELTRPYRTNNPQLLELWQKVRNVEDDIAEAMGRSGYARDLDESIFHSQVDDEIILCLNYDGLYGINNINRFLQSSNLNQAFRWGPAVYKVGDPVLFNDTDRFKPLIYNNLKGTIAAIEVRPGLIRFEVSLERDVTEFSAAASRLSWVRDSTVSFYVVELLNSDDDDQNVETSVPFQVAYAVSVHKAQGLEYESVKVVITDANQDDVSHSILYTAITRARKNLVVYWTPETQQSVLSRLEPKTNERDVGILSARRRLAGSVDL